MLNLVLFRQFGRRTSCMMIKTKHGVILYLYGCMCRDERFVRELLLKRAPKHSNKHAPPLKKKNPQNKSEL